MSEMQSLPWTDEDSTPYVLDVLAIFKINWNEHLYTQLNKVLEHTSTSFAF